MPNLITIFIPTYNRLNLLQRAVTSVLNQRIPVTLHILDNASNDGTQHYLRKLQESYSNIHLTLRQTNLGSFTNFQEGFNSVKTKYLIPLADDDELVDGFLAKALEIAEQDPSLAAVIFFTEVRRHNKKVDEYTKPSGLLGKQNPKDHIKQFLQQGHYVSWSSILWRSSTIKDIDIEKVFKEFGPASDVWFQFANFSRYPVYITNDPGSVFHMHGNQTTATLSLNPILLSQIGKVINNVNQTLITGKLFSEQDTDILMRGYSLWWNKDLCSKPIHSKITPELLFEMLTIYLNDFYPFAGFVGCPLTPLFSELSKSVSNFTHQSAEKSSFIRKLIKQFIPPILLTVFRRLREMLLPHVALAFTKY